MEELIDEISEPGFLQKKFGFPSSTSMQIDKLVIGGHSFGGLTALSCAEKDDRIKVVFTFDPWIWTRNEDILEGQFQTFQPMIHVLTEGFGPICEKHFFYDTNESMNHLLKQSKTDVHELIVLKETNHYHQTDAICIVPMEVCIKSSNKPHINVSEIYLLNTHVVMLFLHKNGIPACVDFNKLNERVKRFESKFLNYKLKYNIEQNRVEYELDDH